MYLLQTKDKSIKSGGPQYFLHEVPDHVKEFLRNRGACPVVLQTPYGIANSPFMAVAHDKKLENGKIVAGRVGKDRIQGKKSIGESIRHWYNLDIEKDFARIDLDAEIHDQGHFILRPTGVTMRNAKKKILEKTTFPLSFHHDFQSKLWKQQIAARRKDAPDDISWAGLQIARVVAEHRGKNTKNVHEADLLRTSGALSVLGLDLSPYLTTGYDCPLSQFAFAKLPTYPCPVEIKKRSARFDYQITRYTNLPRAVVLCIDHDLINQPSHVDVVELAALADYLTAK